MPFRKKKVFIAPYKKISRLKRQLLAAFVCFMVGFGFYAQKGFSTSSYKASVVSVYDGDTFRVRLWGEDKVQKVRIKDMDCFELQSDYAAKQVKRQTKRFNIAEQEVYKRGQQAKELLQNILNQSEFVELKVSSHNKKDKYQRILADVWVSGQNIAPLLIKSGYCFAYIKPSSLSI